MKVNDEAVKRARSLISHGKYVTDTNWSDAQPSAHDENEFLDSHGWAEYGRWYLGIDSDANENTKERHTFPYGDFKRVHRDGVIAAKQRAAQNDYNAIKKAADDLLDFIDRKEGNRSS